MPINIACPQCQRPFVVSDEIAGKSFRCKDCEAVVSVPALKSAPQKSVQPKSAAPKRKATTHDPPAQEEWGYETWQDDQQSELPIPAPRAKRKAVAERSADANKSPVIPIEGMLSIASMAVLGVLNL